MEASDSPGFLARNKASIAAIALLGIVELIFLDITAPYVRMASIGGSGLLFSASLAVALFSAVVIGWSVLKQGKEEGLAGAIRTGTLVALAGGAIACGAMLLGAASGRGLARILPEYVRLESAPVAFSAYFGIFLFLLLLYSAFGALVGALSFYAIAVFRLERREERKAEPK
ncbi:MAG: hypothetical protein N3E51_02845 [Candidatus Micrarchaeota archaeon]|nr:hypothetical protein [Candidatus Micrarchaeota archaeon]